MPITQAQDDAGQRKSKPYNTYHGLTGRSSLGGKRVLKHPKGGSGRVKSKFKASSPRKSRGMRGKARG